MISSKISQTIRLTIAAFGLLVAASGTALAQNVPPPPALRASVTVTSDVVRIGDLVENAGPVANIPIFRSPDLGTTGAVATDRIVDAIRPHELIGIDTRGLTEVIVARASRAIPMQEISACIAQALSGQYGFGDAHNILVTFDNDVRTLQVEPDITGQLQVQSMAFDPRTAHFDVAFNLPSSMEMRRQTTHYTGIATATIDALAVDHPIDRGQVIKASDVVVVKRPKTDSTALTDTNAVVGLAPRHALQPNLPLTSADLMRPEIVQRNDSVTIVYQAPGITLTLRGQAQDSGALGDTISVLNVESKRVVPGIVAGPGRVTVKAVTTRVVDSMVMQPQ
ncbi:MAG TPA: flagellar basal body P-ring formation chaperone FlgA [Xanthobacteraceae bacterium]|jgi:flagella basal body P-ring formation protein FlgA|nr:flagellar basal body P-ring formation chaperone FlgA [Xanthobacteraceae bacterium]